MSTRPIRLAIVSSHPIQYNAPLFRALSARDDIEIKVFYSWRGTQDQIDPEFGEKITWDIPLLDGYAHEFVPNRSKKPGTHHFMGLDNTGMIPAIEAFGPDAVLVYGWSFKTHLAVMRHFKGRKPVFFRGDSTLISSTGGLKTLARRYVLRWVYRHIDVGLYVGENNRKYFLAHGVPADRLVWVPHSIENRRFAGTPEIEGQAAAMRQALGIGEDATVCLFAGKLVARKQPGLLLDAFLQAQRDCPSETHLVYAGTGPLEKELRERVSAVSAENIHFIGFKNQSEMPAIYRLGDVMALPSTRETWGLAVNESMASGRPVIVSDRVGCAPDLVDQSGHSVVFASDDTAALASAMRPYLASRAHCLKLGRSAMLEIEAWSNDAAAVKLAQSIIEYPGLSAQ